MEEIRARIARQIKKYRTERGLSVDEVGMAVGKSGKTISAWEVGRGQPDADALITLCRFFQVDIADFYEEQRNIPDDVQELVEIYTAMNETGREALSRIARELAEMFGR